MECAFLNTLQARWQYAGEAVGLGFAQGKSMLLAPPFLDSVGGIRALAAEIAEDAAATKIVRAAGRRVNLVAAPFSQPLVSAASPRSGPARSAGRACAGDVSRCSSPRRSPAGCSSVPAGRALCQFGGGRLGLGALVALTYAGEYALALRAGGCARPPGSRHSSPATCSSPSLDPRLDAQRRPWRGNAMAIETKPGRIRTA